jgi:hypothetical protein
MNTPNITFIPRSSGADIDHAEIRQGLVKDIEYYSNADSVYDLAVNNAIKCSIGFMRLEHRYVSDDSFEQELCIKRVPHHLSAFLDANSDEIDGSDAMRGTCLIEMTVSEFKEKYPGKEPSSIDEMDSTLALASDDDYITIAEYFEIEEEKEEMALFDGNVVPISDDLPEGLPRREVVVSRKVRRYILSGAEVLEEGYFPGRYIPLVPVYGEEHFYEGKKAYHSLIRQSKDPQRRYNYWASTEAELLIKAPKGMFLAEEGTTEEYADDYKNPDKAMVLRYKKTGVDDQPAGSPQFIPPPQIPSGIINAMNNAQNDIKSTMGLYNAFLGDRSNETSGVAINARKQEGDRAVFHFADNLTKSINHLGNIINYAIPEVYDTPRVVSIIGKEGKPRLVGINGALYGDQEESYDMTQGTYSVRVVTGANYATMRQQAAEFYQQVLQTNVSLMPVIGDLAFEYMDFPGAQHIASRLRKTMDPSLLDENNEDPKLVAAQRANDELQQALQATQIEMQQLQQQLQDKQAEINIKLVAEQNDARADEAKNDIEMRKLLLEEQKIINDYNLKVAELEMKQKEAESQDMQSIEEGYYGE